MKKASRPKADEDMLPEYDFSGGVRGKYAKRFPRGVKIAVLAPDVAEYFPDSDSVNEFLRTVIRVGRRKRRSA